MDRIARRLFKLIWCYFVPSDSNAESSQRYNIIKRASKLQRVYVSCVADFLPNDIK